ncbi:NTP transferase domain-containing protein [Cytobacillus sp. Hz8]|uniref:nucleotidyltransferase family protein n=1 Tax=Cytobacillus sp. Hz8 TaxID=3347168 RepID=UPI0035D81B40
MQTENVQLNECEVWLLVLAAGFSKRMGEQKLLLSVKGETMIRYVVKKLNQTKADGIIVVTNSCFEKEKYELADLGIVILENDESHLGMSSSLKLGIQYLKKRNAGSAIILLADQPTIDVQIINRVIDKYKKDRFDIIQALYQTKPSHPVLFSKRWFDELLQISGDKGARDVMKMNQNQIMFVECDVPEPKDIDTVKDYEDLIKSIA